MRTIFLQQVVTMKQSRFTIEQIAKCGNASAPSPIEQFTYFRGRYWLVGVTKLLWKSVLRGHKSA